MRRLGGSFDWERVAFTMNPVSSNYMSCSGNDASQDFEDALKSCNRKFLSSARRWHNISSQSTNQLVCAA
jgi:hypothetical protein